MNNIFATCVRVNERVRGDNFVMRALRALRGAAAAAQFRRPALLAAALALLAPLSAFAQSSAVAARVTDRVNVSQLTTLAGNTHPLARAQYDQGAAPADLPMNRIMLVLKRSPDQETALQSLLTDQQTTSSANFHKWLTPVQFGQQFGPADADIQAVTSWLASFGFQSIKVSNGRTIIEFSGTAAQVQAGLHTQIHKYVVNGESHWANASDPQIPSALAPVVAGFVSLHNFQKKTLSNRSTQMAGLTKSSNGKPQLNFTDNSHGLAPADFNTIYNIAPSMTGAGVTIGVIARTNIIPQDVVDFRTTFGLSANYPTIILNGPDPTDMGGSEEAEAVLDATWSGAVAPSATVDLVVSESTNAEGGEDLSEVYIIDNNLADIMTESFSTCEAQNSANAGFYAFEAEQAAAQGITYVVASGDSGPDGCADPTIAQASGAGASVNLLASTPYTVAVGGTMFNDIANPGTYWNTANTTSPYSASTPGSAISYIPENVWNESCTVAQCGASLAGLWSSGGGVSSIVSKPIWQAGVAGIPATTFRLLPDVSMAAAGHDGYALCLDASCQGNNSGFSILSGTSAAAQVFGGVMALVDQNMPGHRVGVANFALYKLAGTEPLASCNGSSTTTLPASTCIFNDVTSGNTNLTIVGENGFTATTGYDEATGLGSVNVTNLVNKWSTAISAASTTTLTLNGGVAVNVMHGSSVPVGIVVAPVAPATGTPTGDVSIIAPGAQTGQGADFFTLANGSVFSSSNSTVMLPGGTYQVHAHYQGDGTFLGSDSNAVSVTVNPEGSQTSLGIVLPSVTNPCLLASSIVYGSPYILSVAVADLHSVATPCIPNEFGAFPTGTVLLTDTFNGSTGPLDGGTFKLNSNGFFEDQPIQLAAGTHVIQAAYQGDNSFSKTTPAPTITVTVTKAPTASSVTSSPATVAANTAFSVTVLVDSQTAVNTGSSGVAPTGTVTFTATTAGAVINPSRRQWPGPNRFLVGEVSAMLACLSALFFATKKRRGMALLGATMVIVVAVGIGCGSSSGGGGGGGSTTVTLGTANLSGAIDGNGFAAATVTLSNAKLASSATITATYGGDSNYNGSTTSAVSVTVH